MPVGLGVVAGFLALVWFPAGEPAIRYGVAADLKTWPQATPKETLTSVLKAIDGKKFDYLVAQLADPEFIDQRVKIVYAGRFEEQVQDTRARLDPAAVKLLRRFLTEGVWTTDKTSASVRLKDIEGRVVRFVQKDGRWYLVHASAAK
jgi:hypothetical protein